MDYPLVRINKLLNEIDKGKLLDDKVYHQRFCQEWKFFRENNCAENILFAYYIKEIIASFNIPFFIRGSAAGSLLLYLLDFTTVDPVKNGILFERFMNEYRETLGDIDFDVPRNIRDTIFAKIWKTFTRMDVQIGRISTNVFYKKNSAIREVLRSVFKYHHTVPKEIMEDNYKMSRFFKDKCIAKPHEVLSEASKIIGTLRYSSAHVGGIVLLKETDRYIDPYSNKDNVPLINIDKNEVDLQKRFKVDVLSNSGLDVIKMIYPDITSLDEERFPYKQEVFNMIGEGDTIGIFYGESPLSRNTFKTYHQKYRITSILDIAKCISLIRPMARSAEQDLEKDNSKKLSKNDLIFDDDWIFELSKLLEINLASADRIRRQLAKGDVSIISKLFKLVSRKRLKQLMGIQNYGFCKGHALNYAQLIYCQAYAKWEKPLQFYTAVLNTLNVGRIYNSWVYFLDLLKKGIKISAWREKDNYTFNLKKNMIYPKSGIQTRLVPLSISDEIEQFGGFTSLKNIEEIEGEIACSRRWKGVRFVCQLEGEEIVDRVVEFD